MNALLPERRVAAFFALSSASIASPIVPRSQGRLLQCDEVFEREAGDPPLPVAG